MESNEDEVEVYVVWWLPEDWGWYSACPFVETYRGTHGCKRYKLSEQSMGEEIKAVAGLFGLDRSHIEYQDKFSQVFKIPASWLEKECGYPREEL